jgi:hypothetical protein
VAELALQQKQVLLNYEAGTGAHLVLVLPVEAVDTTGEGDRFTGALAVTHFGAQASMPSDDEEVQAFLLHSWEVVAVQQMRNYAYRFKRAAASSTSTQSWPAIGKVKVIERLGDSPAG